MTIDYVCMGDAMRAWELAVVESAEESDAGQALYYHMKDLLLQLRSMEAQIKAADELVNVIGWSVLYPLEGYDPLGDKLHAAVEAYCAAGKGE